MKSWTTKRETIRIKHAKAFNSRHLDYWYVSERTAAKIAGVSFITWRSIVKKFDVPVISLPSCTLYKVKDILSFMKEYRERKNREFKDNGILRRCKARFMLELRDAGFSLQKIGDVLNISRERVRQILNEDLSKKASS